MKTKYWWVLPVVAAVVISVNMCEGDRSHSPNAPRTEEGYRPSDPSRLAATGRPQLVEFYHRA